MPRLDLQPRRPAPMPTSTGLGETLKDRKRHDHLSPPETAGPNPSLECHAKCYLAWTNPFTGSSNRFGN